MNFKTTHYAFAGASFLIAFLAYVITMQPSIPFWDCGEFAAAAWALQVPHPPGAPLWTIVGRIAMMLPTFSDPVARYNLFSVLSSAGTIMLLYLTISRLIKLWRGEPKSMADALTTFGGAFVGAMAYAFTDSFWFNALECEVYAFGSLFIALIPWLMLVWYDHADEEHSEKYMLLVAYVIGLSMGVHQLALLTIFPCFMLIYYRRRSEATVLSWLGMVVASVIAFFIAYKLVLSKLVEWFSTAPIVSVVLLAGCAAGIWYSQREKKALLNLSLWAAMFLFLGFSTYVFVMVRANQDPPMNQNSPKTFAGLTRYINREQYGDRGQFPRRQALEPGDENKPMFTKYSSDFDFFWRYQTDHMYHRYLYWNYIGRAGDNQDQGADWSKTWGIPFLLGLFGALWHFKRDPKRALSIFAMFAMMGWMTAWYQNQQEPQPRERDYFYVGAFYVYAMWIGIGATGIMEMLRNKKKKEAEKDEKVLTPIPSGNEGTGIASIALAATLVLVPLNMCVGLAGLASGKSFSQSSKWGMYSRERNYIPFDYAYNILQSCDKDAILFTYGDNDTFPLWCLQDVFGIRRDIRIAQLSLSNIGWYIDQLKNHSPWGAKKIALSSFPDETLLVPETDPMAPHIKQEAGSMVSINVTADAAQKITGNPNHGAGVLSWKYLGTYRQGEQNIFTVADQMSVDIIQSNINVRPIYYSVTVPDNYRIGLDHNLITEGMALRVTPDVQEDDRTGYGGSVNEARDKEYLLNPYPATPSKDVRRGMLLRTYNDPTASRTTLDKQYALNYFLEYLRYASYELDRGKKGEADVALDSMDKRLPPGLASTENFPIADVIADLYDRAGNEKMKKKYALIAIDIFEHEKLDEDPNRALQQKYRLANLYTLSERYDDAIKAYKELREAVKEKAMGPLSFRIIEVEARKKEAAGDKRGALDKYEEMVRGLGIPEEQLPPDMRPIIDKRNALRKELGIQ
jgi:tetratricopeptide (TPR) repeat protein